jgi:ATP-dependent Clp protease ATP-binding subunit ClpA
MLREGKCLAAKALLDTGADYNQARRFIDEKVGPRVGQRRGRRSFSRASLRIIERSVQMSWDQADGVVDTEHLLVALLEEQDEETESALAGLDITPQELLHRVDGLMAERDPFTRPVLAPRSTLRL